MLSCSGVYIQRSETGFSGIFSSCQPFKNDWTLGLFFPLHGQLGHFQLPPHGCWFLGTINSLTARVNWDKKELIFLFILMFNICHYIHNGLMYLFEIRRQSALKNYYQHSEYHKRRLPMRLACSGFAFISIKIKPWDKYRLGTRTICQASTLYHIARIFYIRDL